MHGLAFIGHDAAHRVALKNRRINDVVTELFIAWPLFVAMSDGYRPWHFIHHRCLGKDEDSELSYRSDSRYFSRVTWSKIAGYFFLDMCGSGIPDLFRFTIAVLPYKRQSRMLGPVAMWTAFVCLCYYCSSMWIVSLWILSLLTGFYAVFRLRQWTEHVGVPPAGHETSYRFKAGAIPRFVFLPHSTWCHYEHHKWPQIPYYNLPTLRTLDTSKQIIRLWELFPIIERGELENTQSPRGQTA